MKNQRRNKFFIEIYQLGLKVIQRQFSYKALKKINLMETNLVLFVYCVDLTF